MSEGRAQRNPRVVTHFPKPKPQVTKEAFDKLDARVKVVETALTDIADISKAITKLAKYVRVAAPSIIAAAVAAGVVNGKLGAFFNALITGSAM